MSGIASLYHIEFPVADPPRAPDAPQQVRMRRFYNIGPGKLMDLPGPRVDKAKNAAALAPPFSTGVVRLPPLAALRQFDHVADAHAIEERQRRLYGDTLTQNPQHKISAAVPGARAASAENAAPNAPPAAGPADASTAPAADDADDDFDRELREFMDAERSQGRKTKPFEELAASTKQKAAKRLHQQKAAAQIADGPASQARARKPRRRTRKQLDINLAAEIANVHACAPAACAQHPEADSAAEDVYELGPLTVSFPAFGPERWPMGWAQKTSRKYNAKNAQQLVYLLEDYIQGLQPGAVKVPLSQKVTRCNLLGPPHDLTDQQIKQHGSQLKRRYKADISAAKTALAKQEAKLRAQIARLGGAVDTSDESEQDGDA